MEELKYIGYAVPVNTPTVRVLNDAVETTVNVKGHGRGEASYQKKSQISHRDNKSGSYMRQTLVDKASSEEFVWKNGKSGVKDELKSSSTVRVGNQHGYTEVYREERVRDVAFDMMTRKSITRGPYGYNHDSDSDSDDEPFYGYCVCGNEYDSDSD